MKSALEKFIEGATTIVESPKKGVQPTPPILVICPDPPFKNSYFKKHDLIAPGIEKYFWYGYQEFVSKFKNDSTVVDIYMNMSLKLGEDWNVMVFGRNWDETIVLKTGSNEYFGEEIYVEEIRTLHSGLCYKLELPSNNIIPVARGAETAFVVQIRSKKNGLEKLLKVKLLLAANNTWQGISFGNWPYSKIPPVVLGNLNENMIEMIGVKLEENDWKYQTGWDGFRGCLETDKKLNCTSIFDPFTTEIRYLCQKFNHQ